MAIAQPHGHCFTSRVVIIQIGCRIRDISNNSPDNPADFAVRRADADRAQLAALMRGVAGGDRSAFDDLYRRTSAKLFGVCLRIFSEREEAEEALQDAYVTIWNKADRFDQGKASPITWLVAVTRNRAIDRLRRRRGQGLATLDAAEAVADSAPLADAVIEQDQNSGQLQQCVDSLEARDSLFIRTAFLQGVTYSEIAQREGMPLATVKSRMRRALLKLRECMGQ
jgi:RNA polymerase sigma-70 factor (ECF subfamily)